MTTVTILLIAVAILVVLVAFSVIRSRRSAATNTGGRGELGVSQEADQQTPSTTQTGDTRREERRGGCC